MTLVGYGSRSMLSSPVGTFEGADGSEDDVGNRLDAVVDSGITGEGVMVKPLVVEMTEKRKTITRVTVPSIPNMKMPSTINPEVVLVPVKGWRANFPVRSEEFMNLFPCS
jgi:hypothetical protein